MTDTATITFAIGPSYEAAFSALNLDEATGPTPFVILPASLRRNDPLAGAVRGALRSAGRPNSLLLPPHPAAALFGDDWIDLAMHPPDVPATTIALPSPLVGAGAIWTVTDVDAVAGSGPYVLDVIARYVHPRTRLRRLASRRRSDAAVDVNLVRRPAWCVVGKQLAEGLVIGVTRDPIAAELLALALADEALEPDRIATGPWEDRVVQRATELELGIQIPRQIRVHLAAPAGSDLLAALEHVLARIGVTIA